MEGRDVRERLIEALEERAAAYDAAIVDVEVTGASKAPLVRVYVDHADPARGGITLDEVAEATRWVSTVVDAIDPFPGPYTLEVSSPGIERPLRTPADFERFSGERVKVRTRGHEGRRSWTGTLGGLSEGDLLVESDGEVHALPLAEVARVRLDPTLDMTRKRK